MSSALLFVALVVLGSAMGSPAKNSSSEQEVKAGNLKFTFDHPEDIPSAFFDDPAPSPIARAGDTKEPRRIFPSCQDGSGGMCLNAGECPADLRANSGPGACKPNQECCYGFPASESSSCRARGGECVTPVDCGRAPKLTSSECNSGQVCCVFTL